jgi:hypothetical protein
MSLSQFFLVFVPKPVVNLQPTSPLSPLISSPPQHLASLQHVIILALMVVVRENGIFRTPIVVFCSFTICNVDFAKIDL